MKLTSIFSALSLTGVLAFGLGLALNVGAIALFTATVAVLLLLTAITDYSAGPRFVRSVGVPVNRRETHPFAA